MKKIIQIACATLATGWVVQLASAQTVNVQNSQGMGVKVTNPTTTPVYSQTGNNAPYKAYARSNYVTTPTPQLADMGKVYFQFNLASTWATYGQANLTGATLTLWGENGNARTFNIFGLNDSAALDGWNMSTLSWLNAPANATGSNEFDPTKSSLLWASSGTTGVNLATNAASPVYLGSDYDQCARYVSPGAASANILAFLAADTDGLVTFMLNGSGNQNWFVGTGGIYDVTSPQFFTADNQLLRDSPTLTLTFAPVPEPATLSLVALGLGGLFLVRRRK